jgi:hypothetical protein
MTETTRRLAEPAFAGQTWQRKRIWRLVLGHLAERMSALTRFVVCGTHVTIMPDLAVLRLLDPLARTV